MCDLETIIDVQCYPQCSLGERVERKRKKQTEQNQFDGDGKFERLRARHISVFVGRAPRMAGPDVTTIFFLHSS